MCEVMGRMDEVMGKIDEHEMMGRIDEVIGGMDEGEVMGEMMCEVMGGMVEGEVMGGMGAGQLVKYCSMRTDCAGVECRRKSEQEESIQLVLLRFEQEEEVLHLDGVSDWMRFRQKKMLKGAAVFWLVGDVGREVTKGDGRLDLYGIVEKKEIWKDYFGFVPLHRTSTDGRPVSDTMRLSRVGCCRSCYPLRCSVPGLVAAAAAAAWLLSWVLCAVSCRCLYASNNLRRCSCGVPSVSVTINSLLALPSISSQCNVITLTCSLYGPLSLAVSMSSTPSLSFSLAPSVTYAKMQSLKPPQFWTSSFRALTLTESMSLASVLSLSEIVIKSCPICSIFRLMTP